jgi:hypothetical protein
MPSITNGLEILAGIYQRSLNQMLTVPLKRQTIISQFFQLDRLVVEGGKEVRGFLMLDIRISRVPHTTID